MMDRIVSLAMAKFSSSTTAWISASSDVCRRTFAARREKYEVHCCGVRNSDTMNKRTPSGHCARLISRDTISPSSFLPLV